MARRKSLLAKILFPKKRKKKQARKKQAPTASNGWRYKSAIQNVGHVTLPVIQPFEVPEGELVQTVYTYDGRPLIGTRKGSRFLLDVVPGVHSMTSVYTGTQWTSNKAVAYNGNLIGHIGDGRIADELVKLVNRYGRVVVHAKRLGTDPGGWPIIELRLPTGDLDPDHLEFYIPTSNWIGNDFSGSATLSIASVPTPKGSTAKPHIRLYRDGILFAEITARAKCYNQLVDHVGESIPSCEISSKLLDEGRMSHRVILALDESRL